MGDISSGMASTVIQLYLKEILQSYVHPHIQIRKPAQKVVELVLDQGLVHPVQVGFRIWTIDQIKKVKYVNFLMLSELFKISFKILKVYFLITVKLDNI